MEVSTTTPIPPGAVVEQTSISESTKSQSERNEGNKHIMEKATSFQAEETSKMVSESVTGHVKRKVSSSTTVSQSVQQSSTEVKSINKS